MCEVTIYFQARKALLEQLGRVLSPADELLPDSLILVSNSEWQGQVSYIMSHHITH